MSDLQIDNVQQDQVSEIDNVPPQEENEEQKESKKLPKKIEADRSKTKLPTLFPETQREEYQEFIRRFDDDTEYTEEVEDIYEMQLLAKELYNTRILTPEAVDAKIVPRLKEQVDKSNGRLKGYFLWPEYRIGG